jgi:succinyl-diaminopimelate desuccinylase
MDVLDLARELIRVPSTSGSEDSVIDLLAEFLYSNGAGSEMIRSGDAIAGLIARTGAPGDGSLLLSGHVDTVPVDDSTWSVDAFGGDVSDGRIYGRGASDMKSGVAAMTVAFLRHARDFHTCGGVVLALSAAEETGCHGARQLLASGGLPRGGGLVVGEPTGNRPLSGHKGALWLSLVQRGAAAHGSRPEHGVNAITKLMQTLADVEEAVRALTTQIEGLTLNIGTVKGGRQVNVVPDEACAELDFRLPPGTASRVVLDEVNRVVAAEVEVSCLLDLPSVLSTDSWLGDAAAGVAEAPESRFASYFSDAGVLATGLATDDVLIMGPGDPEQAHVTDESCSVRAIEEAVDLYTDILSRWCTEHGSKRLHTHDSEG